MEQMGQSGKLIVCGSALSRQALLFRNVSILKWQSLFWTKKILKKIIIITQLIKATVCKTKNSNNNECNHWSSRGVQKGVAGSKYLFTPTALQIYSYNYKCTSHNPAISKYISYSPMISSMSFDIHTFCVQITYTRMYLNISVYNPHNCTYTTHKLRTCCVLGVI